MTYVLSDGGDVGGDVNFLAKAAMAWWTANEECRACRNKHGVVAAMITLDRVGGDAISVAGGIHL